MKLGQYIRLDNQNLWTLNVVATI